MIPISDRLIILPLTIQIQKVGSLFLAGHSDKDTHRDITFGRVIYVGEGRSLEGGNIKPMKCKKGDIVMFNERVPLKTPLKNKEYQSLRESDVIAILETEDLEGIEFVEA